MKAKMNTQILSRVSQYQEGWGKFSLQSTMPGAVQGEETQVHTFIISIHQMHASNFTNITFRNSHFCLAAFLKKILCEICLCNEIKCSAD